MYAAMFRTFKEKKLSSETIRNIEEAKEYWGKDHERLANTTVSIQLSTLFDDCVRFKGQK